MTELETIDDSAEIVPFRRPQFSDLRDPATDSWTSVVEQVGTLAGRIADTKFVPKELRGDGAAVAACILSGREVRMQPMTALQTINVINGRPAISAEGMRGLVLRAGHSIQFTEQTASRVIIRGRRHGENEWTSVTWTIDDARRAGLGGENWKKYPRQMLTARATTELCRLLFADEIHGLRGIEEMTNSLIDAPEDESDAGAVEPTVTVRRRGRPAKKAQPQLAGDPAKPLSTQSSTEQQNSIPDAPEAAPDAPADPGLVPARKRVPRPSKRVSDAPQGAADESETPQQSEGPSVEQQQDEIRRLSAERRRLIEERTSGAPPAAGPVRDESPPETIADRTPTAIAPLLTATQRASIMMHFARLDLATERDERLWWTNRLLGLEPLTIESANQLTQDQAGALLDRLETIRDRKALDSILDESTLFDDPDPA